MKKFYVGVVIPNWNGKHLLGNCVDSILKQTFRNLKIVIVDNNSSDGSIEFIKKNYPNTKIIKLKDNYGFAKAVNRGIKELHTKYIFVVNNDVILEKNCLTHLVRTIKRKRSVVAVTPKVLFLDKPQIIESAGDYMNIVGQAFHRGFSEPASKMNKEEEVFLVPCTATLFKKIGFERIGLFDETFFAYGEDVDWCLRARISGFRFLYTPKAIVKHKSKATGKRNPSLLEYLCFRNWIVAIIKNFPTPLFFKRLRFILVPLTIINGAFYLIKNGYWKEALGAIIWILKNFSRILKKRDIILRNRKVTINYLEKWMVPKNFRIFSFLKT